MGREHRTLCAALRLFVFVTALHWSLFGGIADSFPDRPTFKAGNGAPAPVNMAPQAAAEYKACTEGERQGPTPGVDSAGPSPGFPRPPFTPSQFENAEDVGSCDVRQAAGCNGARGAVDEHTPKRPRVLPPLNGGAAGGGGGKRQDYLPWDDYFMSVAFLSAMRSKDPSTQVGACIVNAERRIVGIGYNGFPMGCDDDKLPWGRVAEDELDTKYPYVCHAEMNAILNKNSADVKGCSIYVALFPCNECAKLIIQSGISEVVYLSDKYRDTPSMRASRRLLDMAGVRHRQHLPGRQVITIDFSTVTT